MKIADVGRHVRSHHLAGGVVLIAGLMVAALGLGHVPRGWLVGGTGVVTLATTFAVHATQSGVTDRSRVTALSWALVCLVVFILGIATYSVRFDPARQQGTRVWEFVLDGASEVACLQPRGEPGGAELHLSPSGQPLAPICGGRTYYVDCGLTLDDDSEWLRLAGTSYWVPAAAMRPRAGSSSAGLPDC